MNLAGLREAAEREAVLFLPQVEPRALGAWIGLAGIALGVVAYESAWPARDALLWTGLALVAVGMLLHAALKKADTGWRIDFAARRVEPVGLREVAARLEGEGWEIQAAPGDKRSHLAIDLRHPDRGRVARLFDVPVRRRSQIAEASALADTIARRLGAARTGLRF